ncbi:MAG: VCBS repeat-containing protein [bacterium]
MPVKFTKKWIADETYESAGVFDVNNDGILDIVSGAFWYEGPDFKKKHHIGNIQQEGEYFDDFSTLALDINGNGYLDYVTGGWWGDSIRWRENPGAAGGEWKEHIIAQTGNVETTRAWDIDGDGILEIVPNTPGGPVVIYKLITDANGKGTGQFSKHLIYDKPQGHGLGCGDIAGNGRMDIIICGGWLEAPADPWNSEWIFHDDFKLDYWDASVPMLVVDVNGNGLSDIIVGHAHNYGLEWFEQRLENGVRSWIHHPIDPYYSQYHDLQWADIDGDGVPELVTGKRHRAHCGNDPGEWDDTAIVYFKWNGESFTKCIIDFSRIADRPIGLGILFALADLRGTGRLDIVAPGKDGLYVYYNEGVK